MIQENSVRLVHDIRGYQGIICCAIDMLERSPTTLEQEEYQEMLSRNLAHARSILIHLATYTWGENVSDSFNEVVIELNRIECSIFYRLKGQTAFPIRSRNRWIHLFTQYKA